VDCGYVSSGLALHVNRTVDAGHITGFFARRDANVAAELSAIGALGSEQRCTACEYEKAG
jgi:hypothetical protein